MTNDNPLSGYLNEAEKHMGSDMYDAQVQMIKAQIASTEHHIEQEKLMLSMADKRAEHLRGLASAAMVMAFPVYLMVLVYLFKALVV